MLPVVQGEFRAVADPELRFTPSGKAVANVRIAANSRKKNEAGEWVDDKVVWLNLTAWDRLAENIAESVEKGSLIIVKGRLETRSYETKDGEKRQSYDLTAEEVGLALTFDAAKAMRTERSTPKAKDQSDPWATQGNDEPPF